MIDRRRMLSFLGTAPAVLSTSATPAMARRMGEMLQVPSLTSVIGELRKKAATTEVEALVWHEGDSDGSIYAITSENRVLYKRLSWEADTKNFVRTAEGHWKYKYPEPGDYAPPVAERVAEYRITRKQEHRARAADPNTYYREQYGVEPSDSYRTKRAKCLRARRRWVRFEKQRVRQQERTGERHAEHDSSYGERAAAQWLQTERETKLSLDKTRKYG